MAETKSENTIVAPKTRMSPEARFAWTMLGSFSLATLLAVPFIIYPQLLPLLINALRVFFTTNNEFIAKPSGIVITKTMITSVLTFICTGIVACVCIILTPPLLYVYDSRQSWRVFFKDNPYVEKFIDAVDIPHFWFQLGWMLGVVVAGIEAYGCIIYIWYEVSAD